MKNYIVMTIALCVYVITYTSIINSMSDDNCSYSMKNDGNSEISREKIIEKERNKLRSQNNSWNGANITLGFVGLGSGVSTGLGIFFKNKVLEITGVVGSVVSTSLFITSNCLECCQYPTQNADYDDSDL